MEKTLKELLENAITVWLENGIDDTKFPVAFSKLVSWYAETYHQEYHELIEATIPAEPKNYTLKAETGYFKKSGLNKDG